MALDAPLRTILDRFATANRRLHVVDLPYGWAAARGLITSPAMTPLHLVGYNAATPAGGEALWEASTAYTWAVANQTLTVRSTAANDGAGALTGALTVRVWWLNAAGTESTVDVVMNGVNPVVTGVITARRVNRMQVLTAGATNVNEGTITCYWTDNATIFRQIPAMRGLSEGLIQTVPAGYRDVLWSLTPLHYQPFEVAYVLYTRTAPTAPWLVMDKSYSYGAGNLNATYYCPILISANSDYYIWSMQQLGAHSCAVLQGWREAV